LYLPEDLGFQTLPSPPQLAEDPPSLIQGKEPLLWLLLAIFDYWLISFALCLSAIKSNIFAKCANWDDLEMIMSPRENSFWHNSLRLPSWNEEGNEFPRYQRGKKGEIEIPNRKSIPYLLYLPEDLCFQTLPSPPQLEEDPPSLIQGKEPLLWLLLAIFDYWLISIALCLSANPSSVDLPFLQNVQIGMTLK